MFLTLHIECGIHIGCHMIGYNPITYLYDFRSMLIGATKPHQGIVYLSGFLLTIFIARIIGISTSKVNILI